MGFRNLRDIKKEKSALGFLKKALAVFKDTMPIFSIVATFFGFTFIWSYLVSIEKLTVFNLILSSPMAVISILFFFFILAVYMYLPFLATTVFKRRYQITLKDNTILFIYAMNSPLFILMFTIIFLSASFNRYGQDTKIIYFLLIAFTIILVLISLCIFLLPEYQEHKNKLHFFHLMLFSLVSFIPFIVSLLLFLKSSKKDIDFLFILLTYLLFLFMHNAALFSEKTQKIKRLYLVSFIIFFAFLLLLPLINGSFGFQRMILTAGGIAQLPSEASRYFITSKNKQYIKYIKQHHIFQVEENAQDEIYIWGYLVLNLGDVRILCSPLAEKENNSQNQHLDPQKCLIFHAQDIMLMGNHETVKKTMSSER